MRDLPAELVSQVQKYTDAPWWNGQAYAENVGYYALAIHTYRNAKAIEKVAQQLRAAKQYAEADALRPIIANMRASGAKFLTPEQRAKIDAE